MKDLKNKIKLFSEKLPEYPWEDLQFYANWLAQTYYYTLQSPMILARAGAYCSNEQKKLRKRFLEHTLEETSHEILAANDLKSLGLNILNFQEFPETTSFYEVQYYKAQYRHPVSIFGWILSLEGAAVAVGDEIFKRVKTHYGKGYTFLKVHSQEDVDHLDKALEIVGQIPTELHGDLIQDFEQSTKLYLDMLSNCQNTNFIRKVS